MSSHGFRIPWIPKDHFKNRVLDGPIWPQLARLYGRTARRHLFQVLLRKRIPDFLRQIRKKDEKSTMECKNTQSLIKNLLASGFAA